MIKQKKNKILILIFILIIGVFGWLLLIYKGKQIEEKGVEKNKETIKIGFITDAHCYSKQYKATGDEWVMNWRCADPLSAFINRMNDDYRPDVVIDGGDLIDGRDDRGTEGLEQSLSYFKKLKAPYYFVLGNHEVRELTKKQWLETVEYERTYYYKDVKDLRIFVLDGNYYPDGDNVIDADPDHDYNPGIITQEQIDWLDNEFSLAPEKRKVIFIHQPPVDKTVIRDQDELLKNAEELRTVISRGQNVMAVVSGHIEEFCTLDINDVPYYVLQGVWKENKRLPKDQRFEEEGLFYEINVGDENVEIQAYSKLRDQKDLKTFSVNESTSICNNKSILKNE